MACVLFLIFVWLATGIKGDLPLAEFAQLVIIITPA